MAGWLSGAPPPGVAVGRAAGLGAGAGLCCGAAVGRAAGLDCGAGDAAGAGCAGVGAAVACGAGLAAPAAGCGPVVEVAALRARFVARVVLLPELVVSPARLSVVLELRSRPVGPGAGVASVCTMREPPER